MVRGLDYYTRTTFEMVTGLLGSQSAVAAGGRYDGLIADLGGPAIPGIGFAMGVERIALLLEAEQFLHSRPTSSSSPSASRPGKKLSLMRLRTAARRLCCRIRLRGQKHEKPDAPGRQALPAAIPLSSARPNLPSRSRPAQRDGNRHTDGSPAGSRKHRPEIAS